MEKYRAVVISWLPLILSMLNWLLVRYSKPDTKLPLNIPARARPWIPIVIAIVAATVQKFALGSSVNEALKLALIAGLSPMFAHQLVTESLMGGKEIPVPFMVKSSAVTPAVNVATKISSALFFVLLFSGCSGWFNANHARDASKILACISAKAAEGKSPADVAIDCGLENADAVIDLITKSQSVAAAAPKMGKPASVPSASVVPFASASVSK